MASEIVLVLGAYADELAAALAPELGARVLRVRDLVERRRRRIPRCAQVGVPSRAPLILPLRRGAAREMDGPLTPPTSRARRASCASSRHGGPRFAHLRRPTPSRGGGAAVRRTGACATSASAGRARCRPLPLLASSASATRCQRLCRPCCVRDSPPCRRRHRARRAQPRDSACRHHSTTSTCHLRRRRRGSRPARLRSTA